MATEFSSPRLPLWIDAGSLRDEHRAIFSRYRDALYLIEWGLGRGSLNRLSGATIVFRSGHSGFLDVPFFTQTQKIIAEARRLLREHPSLAADACFEEGDLTGEVDQSLRLSDATFLERPGTIASCSIGLLAFRDFGELAGLWQDMLSRRRAEREEFAKLIRDAGELIDPAPYHDLR